MNATVQEINEAKHNEYCNGCDDGLAYRREQWETYEPFTAKGLSEHYFRGFRETAGVDLREVFPEAFSLGAR